MYAASSCQVDKIILSKYYQRLHFEIVDLRLPVFMVFSQLDCRLPLLRDMMISETLFQWDSLS